MTSVMLLEALKLRTEAATCELLMPVKPTKEKPEAKNRTPDVYKTRLPDGKASNQYAPYVLHTVINTSYKREEGTASLLGLVNVRTLYCVYNPDEQEGGLMLLNLMERIRIDLLKNPIIEKQFKLYDDDGIEQLVYPDDTAPFYLGEMITTWKMPPVQREEISVWERKLQPT
jgi:hypothetical protein